MRDGVSETKRDWSLRLLPTDRLWDQGEYASLYDSWVDRSLL